ncbi:response regulator [Treponema ruminis]|uniref:histidine kinase n=1 Tax=Treponema ruminis TaxID=744515 RepID=A0A7W8G9V9_9SPIR|nr:ATP-binding protein [Treponema ruminis]MBB5226386.1 signal transduction histidine kinase/DNA-binding response OmpR family regulator [Treponema ruminis]QSI02709.1 response regulator [Treponema ruminis]
MINKGHYSLKAKTFAGVFALEILTFLLTAGFSFFYNDSNFRKGISQSVILMAEKKQNELDKNFSDVEDAVKVASGYILESIDEERILKDPKYEEEYMATLGRKMTAYPGNPKGVVSLFFRMEAERFGPESGFFYMGNKKTGFVRVRNTDLSKFLPNDKEHVGWYYTPIWARRPVWTNPYENKNIDVQMISYVAPIYKNGELLGVVGMDLKLAVLKDMVETLPVENSLALLIGSERNLIYSNRSHLLKNSVEQSANLNFIFDLLKNEKSDSLSEFVWNRSRHIGLLKKLENGMSLVIAIPHSMITASRINQLVFYLVILLIVLALTWFAVAVASEKIIHPIQILTEATFKLSRGELYSNIPYESKNEIGILADNIRKMTTQMKEYISYIREQTVREREEKEAAISESQSKSEFLASMYLSIHEIDLKNDTFTEIHSRKDIGDVIRRSIGNAKEVLPEVMKQTSDETSWDTLLPFVNLDTINERLKERITVAQEFLGAGGKWCRGRFIAMDRQDDGSLNHVLWAVEYIDAEKKERDQLQTERDRLKFAAEKNAAASQAKSAFLANMSHEIRTPINAVLGMDEMILREAEDSSILGYAANIKIAGTNLLEIVNEILDFSKIEAGKMEILPEKYDVSSIVVDLVNMISERAKRKNLDLIINADHSLPKILLGDSVRLKQCILNLLTNAVKYTNEGSVTFSLGYEKLDEKSIALKVSVKDTGIGIKKADMEKLCSPFERIEEEKNRTIEGTGLGMSIVTRILSMMGTKLEVQSEYGKGSDFSFVVVQEVLDWEEVGDVNEAYKKNALLVSKYKEKLHAPRAKLLFVDDTEMNLEVVKGLLKKTGIQIDTALSGREALQKVQQETYDILFIDHRMPEMDGIETLHEMEKLESNLCRGKACIALTANAISGVRQMYLDEGFSDYLSKPVEPSKLEEMIKKYLPPEYLESVEPEESIAPVENHIVEKVSSISEIEFESALANCGTPETLELSLKQYCTSADEKALELQQFFEAEDWANYGIKIHALKSTSRLIGANEISGRAEHLENCADSGEFEEIQKEHKPLMNDYLALKEKIRQIFLDEDDGEKTEISEQDFTEKLEKIGECAESFDIDGLDAVMEELEKCKIPDGFSEKYAKIRGLVDNVDFIALKEFLQTEK